MPLERIGSFELRKKLGEGGMGEVYLATDPRLGRDVALKILPASFVGDPVLMARFEREARLLAALSHPNIAIIHGFEETGETKALVMEHIPGEDLSTRIKRGAVPVDEALPLAIQIARGLEAAHLKGVVHRDLKPSNVRITPEGVVKLLDFGIAKSMEVEGAADLGLSPTLSLQATQKGVLLGTAAYMSPEQARGRPVDARTDVFSFGCLLFEMLSGERAFEGEDVSEILASVIKKDVRWDRFPVGLPETLRRVVSRCLAGDVNQRYQAIGDVRYDLERILEEPDSFAAQPGGIPRRAAMGLIVLALVTGALGGGTVVAWILGPAKPAADKHPLIKFTIDAPGAGNLCFSPDGSRLAYTSGGAVWVRRLERLEAERLQLPWSAAPVAWSRDGGTLVLYRPNRKNGELWRVLADGGEPRLVGALPDEGFLWGVSPRDEERLLVGMATGGIVSIPLAGGPVTSLVSAAAGETLVAPSLLPDGRTVLFTEATRGRIETWDGRRRSVLLEMAGDRIFDAAFTPSGHLLFRHTGGKSTPGSWAVPFSAETNRTTGAPFRMASYGDVSVSSAGAIAFRETVTDRTPRRLVWVERNGRVSGTVGEALPGLRYPALSPDGTRIAAAGIQDETGFLDLFVFDRGSGVRYPLHDDIGSDRFPFWRDGRTLGFTTWAAGIRHLRERSVDGTSPARLIDDRATNAGGSRDGGYVWMSYEGLRILERGHATPRELAEDGWYYADISPNDRFIALSRLGDPGILVRRFPEGPGVAAVTSQDTDGLRWSADGHELFFWTADQTLMCVPFDTTADDPKPGRARALFPASAGRFLTGPDFDVAPGGRFLMAQDVGEGKDEAKDPGIVITQNWAAEFGRR